MFSIFFILIYVLFFQQVQDTYRDLINILIGTYVAVLTKTADYWFKDKDDPEHKETIVSAQIYLDKILSSTRSSRLNPGI